MWFRRLLGLCLVALCACGGEVQGDPFSEDGRTAATDTAADDGSDDPTGTPTQPTPPTTPTTPTPPTTPTTPAPSTVPTKPITFQPGQSIELDSPSSNYFILVPRAYDTTHRTPIQLYIYLHGCGGESSGDVWAASNIDAEWIGLAPGGAEGGCWDNQAQGAKIVLDAIADVKTHFNIDPKRILIGGYSSGGDLSYYTAFRNASTFAGVLSHNSIPTYNTNAIGSLAAMASWKFPIFHLAAVSDGTYAIASVRTEMNALSSAGFAVTLIERPGTHYDTNTTPNRNNLLFPHLYDDLAAP